MRKWWWVAIVILVAVVLLVLPKESFSAQRFAERALCDNPEYTCIKMPKGENWKTLFPDENERNLVMRINRMNIQASPGTVIALPIDMKKTYLEHAPFPAINLTAGNKTIIVDPALNAWGAYDETGHLVNWGPAALGKDWCPDIGSSCRTVTGQFEVYRKGGPNCASSKFPIPDGGAPMPYCMYFKGGYALHASTDVPGVNASHGCVRLFHEDAEWLNRQFVDIGTTVIVRPYTDSA